MTVVSSSKKFKDNNAKILTKNKLVQYNDDNNEINQQITWRSCQSSAMNRGEVAHPAENDTLHWIGRLEYSDIREVWKGPLNLTVGQKLISHLFIFCLLIKLVVYRINCYRYW